MRKPAKACVCGRAMRYELRVPGVFEAGRIFTFFSCACGRVDCVPDKAEAPAEALHLAAVELAYP